MAQSTNAAAYKRLEPLQNTNTGAVVEEHIRFWKKYKDEEEANKLAMEAKKREYESQIAEKYDKAVTGLAGTDVLPYFQDSMVSAMEYQSPELAKLAKDKIDGVPGATLKYDAKVREFKEASGLATALSAKLKESNEKIQSNDFNKVLDQPMVDLTNALNNGQFVVDKKTLKLRVYSQDGKKILFDGSSEQLKNDYLSSGFNKKVDFDTEGTEIAKGIVLPDVNGNIQWTPDLERIGKIKAASKLESDPTLMETYKRMNNIYKPTEEMSPLEKNTLATNFFENYVRGGVKTKDNSQANANTRSLMNARNVAQANAERELQIKESKLPTLKLATTATGQPVTEKETVQSKGQPVSSKTSNKIWTNVLINNGGVITTDAGNKKTTLTAKILKISDNGDIKMEAQQLTKTPIYYNGDIVDYNEEVTPRDITNETELGLIATSTYSKKLGRNYENLEEMVNEAKGIIGTPAKAFDAEAFYKNRKSQK